MQSACMHACTGDPCDTAALQKSEHKEEKQHQTENVFGSDQIFRLCLQF